jgi:hypothetical protein
MERMTRLLAGLLANTARLLSGIADPQELRMRRARQGLLAGATAGAAGGLLLTAMFIGLGFMRAAERPWNGRGRPSRSPGGAMLIRRKRSVR